MSDEKQSLLGSNDTNDAFYGSIGYACDSESDSGITADARSFYTRKQSVLAPTNPINLSWQAINAYAQVNKGFCCRKTSGKKHILKDITGHVSAGELVALMGASGAGKTTLLNVLTHRNTRKMHVSGCIRVNGQEIGRGVTSVSAYVQQDDLLISTLTVREHLIFQAILRLPSDMSRKEKIQRADAVIFELGLTKCANTRIGSSIIGTKGISGGEAKRLAFASEVLTNPPLLFCDEPTTGLDSFMAESVVRVLVKMAGQGKTVVCTIHQPASEVYAMFDRVLLLAEGRTAYMGSTVEALKFFKEIGYPCPLDYNPADFYIQKLAIVPGKEEKCRNRVERICEYYQNSEYAKDIEKQLVLSGFSSSVSSLEIEDISKRSLYRTSWIIQFFALLWRSTLDNFRNHRIVVVKLIQKFIIGMFLGLCYLNTHLNQTGIMNLNGALFFMLLEYMFPAIFGVLNILPTDFPVLVREHHSGLYQVSSYYLSKIVSFMPVFSIDGILFTCICYFMTGLRPTLDAFLIVVGLGILMEQVSCAFGAMLSSVSPSFPIALTIAGPILTLIQMTGGLYSNINTLPPYLSWIQYVSWVKYEFEALAINQWHSIKKIACEQPNIGCKVQGDEVLSQYGFNADNFYLDIGLLGILGVVFYFIGYLALQFRVYRAR